MPASVAFFGSGPEADHWVSALAEWALPAGTPQSEAAAVVLGPGIREPLALAREALLAGRPVLWACGQLPDAGRLAPLARFSVPGGPFLRFYEPFQYQGGFAMLQRFLRGPEPFWRPLYLRILAGGRCASFGGLEYAAIEALAACQALLMLEPEQVTAVAVRWEHREPCALFLTVQHREGPVLQCTATLTEGVSDELVVVTPGRTLTLAGSRLRIASPGPGAHCEREFSAPNADPVVEEVARFIDAVSKRDASAGNSDRWLRVASLWSAVRQSINQGGPVFVPALGKTETPPFKLIEGGGRAARMALSRRPLTLVAN